MYFVISNCDGDTYVRQYTKEALLKMLKNSDEVILPKLPKDDTNYWGDNILIIKGEIVSPTEKKVVVELDIE
jgi:hypothetical protein